MNTDLEKDIKNIFDESKEGLLDLINRASREDEIYSHIVITMAAFAELTQFYLKDKISFTIKDFQKAECSALRRCADGIEKALKAHLIKLKKS